MDITHEPTFFSHATTFSHHTDIQYGLLSARELFCVQKKEMAKLLVVVQDDAVYYDDDLDDMCQNFGVAYHSCCCSLELDEKYLMRAASEIMFKVLKLMAYESKVYSSDEEMEEDDGGMDADLSHKDNEEILDSSPSKNLQQHAEKSFTKKRNYAHCDHLQIMPSVSVTNGTVKNWACVCFAPLPEYRVYYFSQKLRQKCASLGMDFCLVPKVFFEENPAWMEDIENKLWTVYGENHTNSSKIDLLTIILPQAKEFHVKIEEVCNHMGVVCQYFLPMSAISPRMKYLGKAAREIRSKVVRLETGQLQQPAVCKCIESLVVGPIILFGAGVSHGISSQTVSVVASMKWPEIITYRGRAICSKELTIDFSLARYYLEGFCETNGKRAERIMFFRHVESPLNELVVTGDIIALKKASESISKEYQPPITYIAVSTNKSNVISPATVCDDVGLNSTTRFGFSCDPWDEETATAHYGVFLDENSFSPCVLESFCLNLCTPFYRWAMPAMPMVPPASLAATIVQDKLRESEE